MANYNRKDHLYKKAKDEGYRSRAAYKLQELQKKYGVITAGGQVLDVGAWPGGWSQVALEHVGTAGKVVAIDLVPIDPLEDERFVPITGDVRDLDTFPDLVAQKFDLVMSDMSAKLTGIREADRAAAVGCAELALWVAQQTLKPGGSFVVKVFKGPEVDTFVKSTRSMFNKLLRTELESTRTTSNEFYVVGLGFKGS